MTPDDMEAVVSEWLAMVETVEPDRFVESLRYPPISQSERDALRALLLDYQERGRALEFVRGEARRGQTVRPGDACLVLIEARARASLKATDTGREG